MVPIIKMKKFYSTPERGQATVEGVLLIALSVLIILGLMSQIYRPLNDYLNAYMGPDNSYLQCLLDVGELPSLGGGEISGECNVQAFAPGAVRPDGFAPSGQGGDLANRDRGSSRRGRDGSRGAGEETGSGGDGSSGGGGGRNLGTIGARGFDQGTRGSDSSSRSNQTIAEAPEELARTRFINTSGTSMEGASSGNRRFIPVQGIAGVLAREREQIERRQNRIRSVASVDGGALSRDKKLIVPKQERKIAEATQETAWSFGRFFRIAIIIMMIVAIVLFIGGQILSISKGMEK